METLLALALIAGDPDIDWGGDAPAPPPLVTPAPAPPPVDPAPPVPDAETGWAVHVEPPPRPMNATFRVAVEVTGGISPSSKGQLGLALELAWYPVQFVRLHGTIGGAWIPVSSYMGTSNRGVMRLLAGVDGVLPFSWGEVFIGIDSGTVHTNATAYENPYTDSYGYYAQWTWQPALRVRGGFDVTSTRPLIIGFDFGYELFAVQYNELHWADLHARVGIAF